MPEAAPQPQTPVDAPQVPPLDPLPSDQQTMLDDLCRWLGVSPSSTQPGDNDEDDADELPAKNRPTSNQSWEKDTAPNDAILAARFFKRGIDAHRDVMQVLFYGAQARWGKQPTLNAKQQRFRAPFLKAFDALLAHVPQLVPVRQRMYATKKTVWRLFKERFRDIAQATRHADTTGFKPVVHELVVPNPAKDVLDPPLQGRSASKGERGFKHPHLRKLLMGPKDSACFRETNFKTRPAPAEDIRTPEQLSREQKIMTRITASQYKASKKQFPSFLYADGSYLTTNPRNGLCRGEVLLRALRRIWTTPSSTVSGIGMKGIPRNSNAAIHKIDVVTGAMVAYAACQVLVTLMPNDWDRVQGNEDLYNKIIDLFNDHPIWVRETLEFLSSEILDDGKVAGGGGDNDNDEDDEDDEDDMAVMAELGRQERELAAAAAAATVDPDAAIDQAP